jgi:DNA-binding transcriptional MocR family regulator
MNGQMASDFSTHSEFKYHQLAHALQCAIFDGLYEPGERLPSIRKIAHSYKVSITTVKLALEQLVSQDLIAPQARSGFYVVKNPDGVDLVEPDHDLVEALIEECCVPRNDTIDSSLVFAVLPQGFTPKELISKAVTQSAKESHPLLFEFADYETTTDVRLILSRYAMESGITLDPREIVFADGFLNALESSLILLNPERKPVAIEEPTNFAFIQVLENLGMPIIPLTLEPQSDGSYEFDLNTLEWHIRTTGVGFLIISTSVRNPLGDGVSRNQRKKLASLLERTELILLEDDTLRDTVAQPLPPIYTLTQSKRVLWFSSFAETLTPTLKFCWIAAGSFHHLLRDRWRATTCAISGIQLAVTEAILQANGYKKIRNEIQMLNYQALLKARDFILTHFPQGTKVTKPIGGYALWIQLPQQKSGHRLYRKAKLQGFSFIPGIAFSPGQHFDDHIRIAPGNFGPNQQHLLLQLATLISESEQPKHNESIPSYSKENTYEPCACKQFRTKAEDPECYS